MEAASLQSLVLIEAEDTQTFRSGCTGKKTRSMQPASNGSAEREAVQARHPANFGCAGSRSGKTKSSTFSASASTSAKKFRGLALRLLCQPVDCKLWNQGSRSGTAARSRSERPGKALPNPSLKPRPNSKTPGPRYSAVHHLQRGPGVFLSVPA
jgi:hypothetical protein